MSAVVILTRLAHWHLIWIEEAYGLAAAAELVRGKALYRDIWFDKPPLYALFYTIAPPPFVLRIVSAAYVLGTSSIAFAFARKLWSEREALLAFSFVAFFLTFDQPATVIALAPDALMVLPHLAAVYLAWSKRPLLAGAVAAIALLMNTKGLFVLASALVFAGSNWPRVLVSFAAVSLAFAGVLSIYGALHAYLDQVWRWGLLYARDPLPEPIVTAVRRSAGWLGFHLTLIIGAAWFLRREFDRRFLLWFVISVAAVAGGLRFFPRYYFQLLPVAALMGARGLMLMPKGARVAALGLLLIPLLRFGPRYATLIAGSFGVPEQAWSDTAMMEDSRHAANLLAQQPGDTLFTWGYRPDVYVFSKLPAGTPFLDSQPVTGVLADRHLVDSRPTAPDWARENRRKLVSTKPTWIVDGLGPYNPALAITNFPDLASWLNDYVEVDRTTGSVIYRRREVTSAPKRRRAE
ncbi:MAG TPA: hypothetical protein VE621_02710 [Bryobacteraceae bacterium]|nr:hypothetical protein [Bryobacteraceae bacterium]